MEGFTSPQALQVVGFERKLRKATLDSDTALNVVLCSALCPLSLGALFTNGSFQRFLECFFSNTGLLKTEVCVCLWSHSLL